MSQDDLARHIELEVPGIGIVENAVAEIVCLRDGCTEQVTVDPATLVVEDNGCEVVSSVVGTDEERVEIYCSETCRNAHYEIE